MFYVMSNRTVSGRMIQIDVNTYPALLSVIEDRTVRAKLAHLGSSVDTLLDPLNTVLVRLIHEVQRAEIYTKNRNVNIYNP